MAHEFSPPIYVSGARDELKRLSSDLWRRGFVTGGRWEKRREFWTGEEIEVLRLNVSDSSNLSSLREIAAYLIRRSPSITSTSRPRNITFT